MDATKLGFRPAKFSSTWAAHKAGQHPPNCRYCEPPRPPKEKNKPTAKLPSALAVAIAMDRMFPERRG